MPDGRDTIAIQVISDIGEVAAEDWDACAGADNPFLSHAFLSALEESGSATAETGWLPQHLTIKDDKGLLLASAPCYLKNHSRGEYVFDWGWADAYERAGGRYYPKLQCSVPFTPATGPRLLVRDDGARDLKRTLGAGLAQLCSQVGASSVHITFPTEEDADLLIDMGYLPRIGLQFHWHNEGYRTFDDFLAALSSRKRKAIRKERAEVASSELVLETLTGSDLTEAHWDAFYHFYRDTSDRKWGQAYLSRSFFSLIGERMPESIVLVLASKADGTPVGGALNLRGSDTIFGRHWGCLEDYKFLHFEACYYRAIDFAIENGLKWVEAGAQGPHKLQRGYLPKMTRSAHFVRDKGFRSAIETFLTGEAAEVRREIDWLMERSPFRKENGQ
ncbi:MAG: GNAT family N-acetyltransferase [Magnetovibrionaceae bacterium]